MSQMYLTERPRLSEQHLPLFEALTQTEAARVLVRMEQDMVLPKSIGVPGHVSGRWLLDLCRERELDHASVVFPLCRETDEIGVSALEKLVGRPIQVWRPPPRQYRAPPPPAGVQPARPEAGTFHPDQVVLEVAPNPKKPGTATWSRYQHWRVGDTVATCMARGLTRADILWDIDYSRKFVKLGEVRK